MCTFINNYNSTHKLLNCVYIVYLNYNSYYSELCLPLKLCVFVQFKSLIEIYALPILANKINVYSGFFMCRRELHIINKTL